MLELCLLEVILYFGAGIGGAGRCGTRGTFSSLFLSVLEATTDAESPLSDMLRVS